MIAVKSLLPVQVRTYPGGLLLLVCFLAQSALSAPSPVLAASRTPVRDWIALAVENACANPDRPGFDIQNALPGSWLLEELRQPSPENPARVTTRFALPGGDELVLESRLANGVLRQFRASVAVQTGQALKPRFLAIADGSCTVRSAREIRDGDDPWIFLDQLDGDLQTLRWTETLQAPWPQGQDPGGVRIGLVDSGLAYDLPLFQDRLARDPDDVPLGYDFWDLDPFPYDGDTSRGAFLPIRHGTAVASIIAREAPGAALVPYRYPRPDMSRMEKLVKHALKNDIKILAMPLGSRKPADWEAFAAALKDQDILAIVSAGNDGRDIDADPVYPAGLDLDNILTVTSADAFGRLARGSNWGVKSVDVMLPAENMDVIDFRGASGVASGSSYAVPRLAALAARLLAKEPDLTALQLKARILERAVPSPFQKDRLVSSGWIPDPEAD
ncbi:S8 family serine peptidase [Roseibium sp.]|uniref:S8 family serine peptidase n=1 Tax=Roseibium sp. TaxID=1936156 RepID=UPI003BA9ECA7